MQAVVLLDVDGTLIIKQYSNQTDEGYTQTLNYPLLETLKASGNLDVYLFTNMDLVDIKQKRATSITRYELVEELTKLGFRVHGVITPADPAYNRGIGAAYRDYYQPTYEKFYQPNLANAATTTEKDALYAANAQTFKQHIEKLRYPRLEEISQLELDRKYSNNQNQSQYRAGQQKSAMFDYFLANLPDEVKYLLYADDQKACLDFVTETLKSAKSQHYAHLASLTLTSLHVDDQSLQLRELPYLLSLNRHALKELSPVPFSERDQANAEVLKYVKTIEQAMPNALLAKLRTAVNAYIEINAARPWLSNMFHGATHGTKGRQNAEGLLMAIEAMVGQFPEKNPSLIKYLADSTHGNTHPHSFRTMLLATLLGKSHREDNLMQTSRQFERLLTEYKAFSNSVTQDFPNREASEEGITMLFDNSHNYRN